jgi:shikimate kinase
VSANITLIGMPGSGKTTLGKQIAQHTARDFIDTDELIEQKYQQPLQSVMNEHGAENFLNIETETLLGLNPQNTLISTGGSAVYSQTGMTHLRSISTIIYLDVPLKNLKQRITNFQTRGLYKSTHQTLEEIYHERRPLYQKYAHHMIQGKDISLDQLKEYHYF